MSDDIVTVFGAEKLVGPQEGVGFWHRFLARAIDLVVHYWVVLVAGIVGGFCAAVLAAVRGVEVEQVVGGVSERSPTFALASVVGSLALHTLATSIHGSSLGKRICGITVVSESGAPAGFGAAIKRELAFFVDALFFGLVAAGQMSQSTRCQRLGDRWGRTVVVKLATIDQARRRSGLRFTAGVAAGMMADWLLLFGAFAAQLS